MTLQDHVTKSIVSKVLLSRDYRVEIVNKINADFLQFTVEFFKKIVEAKFNSQDITVDWYKEAFLNSDLPSDEIAINSGLNKKTIKNMYRSEARDIVINASNEHYESLANTIQALVDNEKDVDLTLNLKFNGVSVDLNLNESLIVINTLAVKRAALRGGAWSTVGKQAEKYLMLALCKLYGVSEENYNAEHFVKNKDLDVDREIDFYLKKDDREYKCEVKLMGQGNPESADAIIARGSNVFVADTLSQQNKNQCDQLDVCWVACRDHDGYKRFKLALDKFGIPYTDYNGDLEKDLPAILDEIFK